MTPQRQRKRRGVDRLLNTIKNDDTVSVMDTKALHDDMMAALHKTTLTTANRYYSSWDVRLDQGRLGTSWVSLYYHSHTTNHKSSSRGNAQRKMHLRDLRDELLLVYDQDIPPPYVSRYKAWHYQYHNHHSKNEYLSLYSSPVMGTYCLLIHIESLLDQQQYPTTTTATSRRRPQRSQHSTTVKRLLQELQSRLYHHDGRPDFQGGGIGLVQGIFYLRHVLKAPKLFASHVVQQGLSILQDELHIMSVPTTTATTTTTTTPLPQCCNWNAMYVLLGCSKEDWRTMEEKFGVDYPAQLLVQLQQTLDSHYLIQFLSSSRSSSSTLYWEGGTCGVVGVLLRAAQVYQSQDYLRQAWELCQDVWNQIEKHDNDDECQYYHNYRGGIGNGVPGIAMTFWMLQQYCTNTTTRKLWQDRATFLLQRCMREWNSIFSASSKSPLASSPSRQFQAWFGLWDGLGGLLSVLMYCQQQQNRKDNDDDHMEFPLFASSRQPQDQVPIRLDLSSTADELKEKSNESADNLEIMDSLSRKEEIEAAPAAPDTSTTRQAPQARPATKRATRRRSSDTPSSLRVDTTAAVSDLPTTTRRRRRTRPPINAMFAANGPTARRPQRSPGVRLTRAAQLRMQESNKHRRISPHSRLTPKAMLGESSDSSTTLIPKEMAAVEDRRRNVQAQQDAKRRKSMDSRRHRQEQELQKRRELQMKREAKQVERRAQIQAEDQARQEAVRLQKQQVLEANRERVQKLARERAQRREQLQQQHTEAQARIRIKAQNEQARLARAKAIREQLEGVSSSMAVVNENTRANNVTKRDGKQDISSGRRTHPTKTVARTRTNNVGPTKKRQHQDEKIAKVQKSKKVERERLERKRHDDQRRIETVQAQILSKKLTKLLQQEQQEQVGDDSSPNHLNEAVPESKTASNDGTTKEQLTSPMSCKETPVAQDEPNNEDLVAEKSVEEYLVAGSSSTVNLDADNSIDEDGTSIKSTEASSAQDIPDPSFSGVIPYEDDWTAVGSTVESTIDEQTTSIKSNETGRARQGASAVLGEGIKANTMQDVSTPNVEPLHIAESQLFAATPSPTVPDKHVNVASTSKATSEARHIPTTPEADGKSVIMDEKVLSCTKESNQDGEIGSDNIGMVSNEVDHGVAVASFTRNDENGNDKIDIPPTGTLNHVHLDIPTTDELVEDESFAQNDEDRSSDRPSLVADLSLTNDKEFESVNAMFAHAENILESQLEDIFGSSSAGDDPAPSPISPTKADIAAKATPSMELACDNLAAAAVPLDPSTGAKEEVVPEAPDSLDVSSVHAMEASNDNQEKLQVDEQSTTFEKAEATVFSANKGPEQEYVSADTLQIADSSTIVSTGSNTKEMHKRKIEGIHDTEGEMPVDLATSASAQDRIQEGHDGQSLTIQRVHSKETNITDDALSENILSDTFDSIDGEEGGFVVVDAANKDDLGRGIADTSFQITPQEESAATTCAQSSIPSPHTASCELSKVESSVHEGARGSIDAKSNVVDKDIALVDNDDNEEKEEEDSHTSDGFGRMNSLFAQADQDLQAELASILGTPETKPDSSSTALSPLADFDDDQELLDSIVEEDAGLSLSATHKTTASMSAELVPESNRASLRRRRSQKVAPADK